MKLLHSLLSSLLFPVLLIYGGMASVVGGMGIVDNRTAIGVTMITLGIICSAFGFWWSDYIKRKNQLQESVQ